MPEFSQYITLTQLNARIPEVDVNAQQLANLGFGAVDGASLSKQCTDKAVAARLRSAKLYLATDVPHIRKAIAAAMNAH